MAFAVTANTSTGFSISLLVADGISLEAHDVYESGNGGYIATHTFPDITANGADPYVLAFGIPRVDTDITSWTIEGSTPTSVDSRIVTNVAGVDVRGRLVGGGAITNVIGTSDFKLMAGVVASFNNVNQTAPTAGSNSAEGYGTTASLSYTGTAGNLLVVCVSTQDDRTIINSNCTTVDQISHADSNLGSAFMGIVEATGSLQTIGGTWTGDTVWSLVVIELAVASEVGGINLTVDDSTSGSSLENIDLVSDSLLEIADLVSSSTLETYAVTQKSTIAVNELVSASTLDHFSLTQKNALVVADLLSNTTLEQTALSVSGVLEVFDALSSGSVDAITITQKNALIVSSLDSASLVEGLALSQKSVLILQEMGSASSLDELVITPSGAGFWGKVLDISVYQPIVEIEVRQLSDDIII